MAIDHPVPKNVRHPKTDEPTDSEEPVSLLASMRLYDMQRADAAGRVAATTITPVEPIGGAFDDPVEQFQAGVESGISGVSASMSYFGALLATIGGNEERQKEWLDKAALAEEISENSLGGLQTFGEFLSEPTIGGFVTQAATKTGQAVPSIAAAIASALVSGGTLTIGGAAGRELASRSARKITQELVKDIVEREAKGEVVDAAERAAANAIYDRARKQVASKMGRDFKIGAFGGAYATEAPIMQGESFAEFVDADIELTPERAKQSLAIGAGLAAIGVGGEAIIVRGLARTALAKAGNNPKSAYRQYAESILGSASIEGLTEATQEGGLIAQRLSVDKDYSMADAQLRLAESAFGGFLAGGAVGGLGGGGALAVQKVRNAGQDVNQQAKKSGARVFERAREMLQRKADAEVETILEAEETGVTDDVVDGTPTPEADADIDAQINAALDPNSSKLGAWIPESTGVVFSDVEGGIQEFQYRGKTVFAAHVAGKGTIITADRAVAERIVRAEAAEDVLASVLGFSGTKPENADRVVRVTNPDGSVVSEQLANEETQLEAETAANGIRTEEQIVETVPVDQALKDRKQRRDNERNAEIDVEAEPETQQVGQEDLVKGDLREGEVEPTFVRSYAAPNSPESRQSGFNGRFEDFLETVPQAERQQFVDLKDQISDSLLKRLAAVYSEASDTGVAFFIRENEDGGIDLFEQEQPDSVATRERELVSKLTSVARNPSKEPTRFSIITPQGRSHPARIRMLIQLGKQLNQLRGEALIGEALRGAQVPRQGLITAIKELTLQGYELQISGRPVSLTPRDYSTGRGRISRAAAVNDGGREKVWGKYTYKQLVETPDPKDRKFIEAERKEKSLREEFRERAKERAQAAMNKLLYDTQGRATPDELRAARKEAIDKTAEQFEDQRILRGLPDGQFGKVGETTTRDGRRIIDYEKQEEATRKERLNEDRALQEAQKARDYEKDDDVIWSRIVNETPKTPDTDSTPRRSIPKQQGQKYVATTTYNGNFQSITRAVIGKSMAIIKPSRPVDFYTIKQLEADFKKLTDQGGMFAGMQEPLQRAIDDFKNMPKKQHGRTITTGDRHLVIVRGTDKDAEITDAFIAAVAGHEMGHILFQEEYANLTDKNKPFRRNLWEAYKKFVAENDMQKIYDSESTDRSALKNGFEEWYADQVAAFVFEAAAEARENTRDVDPRFRNTKEAKAFRAIANKMRRLIKAINDIVKGRFKQSPEFKDYMDGIVQAHKLNRQRVNRESNNKDLSMTEKLIVRDLNIDLSAAAGSTINTYDRAHKMLLKNGTFQWFSRHLMASDNYLRGLGPKGKELAQIFYGKSQSTENVGFHARKSVENARWLNELAKALDIEDSINEAELAEGPKRDILLEAEDDTKDMAQLSLEAQKVRQVFERFYDEYLTNKKGKTYFSIKRRENYAPRTLDTRKIEQNPDAFIEFLEGYYGRREAEQITDGILANRGEHAAIEDRAAENDPESSDTDQLEAVVGAPGMNAALVRKLAKVPTKDLRNGFTDADGWLQPPGLSFTQYFHYATRKVEYMKMGGPKRVEAIINAMPEEHQQHAIRAVEGNLGKLGTDMGPFWREMNSIAAVHTILTTLLFTVFASITDLAGVVTRAKEFSALSTAFDEMKNTLTGKENMELARAVGVVTNEALDNMFISVGELDFAGPQARKLMRGFFKYTGLDWYTKYTRAFAAGMGREFIINTANHESFGPRQERYLKELGLTKDEVLQWDKDGRPLTGDLGRKVSDGIARFANEAIIRPNAAQRPTWASNPYLAMVWQLKSYFYAYGKTVIGGLGREIKNRYREDGEFRGGAQVALLAVGLMLPLTLLGWKLREHTKWWVQWASPFHDADNSIFRSRYMDDGEFLTELVDRTGALGPYTLALSTFEGIEREGLLMGPVISNIPFVDAFDDTFFDGDWERPIPVVNNVQG